jgi:diguanylate cyclase
MRRTDLVARYGGEEFVVLMPGTAPESALARIEAIRREIAGSPLELPDGQPLGLDFSAGIAGTPADVDHRSPKALLGLADARLLAAKRAGRGQCVGRVTVPPELERPERPERPEVEVKAAIAQE